MSEVTAASLLAVIGVFDLVGTLCSGWLTDRYDPRWLLFWYYGLRGLSLLALPFVIGSSNLGLIAFVVFYGLDWVATVPPTVAITAQAFGRERVGVVFGWIFGAHQLGAAVAAWGAGAARTWFGDYQAAFVTAGLLSLDRGRARDPDRRTTQPASSSDRSQPRSKLAHDASRGRSSSSLAAAALPAPAAAHPRLVDTTPAADAELARVSTKVVVVRLSEPADPVGDGITVTGPDGRDVARGPGDRLAAATLTRAVDARAAGHLRRRVARRRRRHAPRPRLVPVQRRRAHPHGAPGPRRREAWLLTALGRWLSLAGFALGFGVVFAALLSGGMTERCWRLVSAGRRC